MQVLIPMSGQGTRYKKAGYLQPKPLIPVSGRPIIARLLEKIPREWPVTFVLAENHRSTELSQELLKLRPEGQPIFIPVHHKGPSYATKFAFSSLKMHEPVLVTYCDFGFKWDPWDFQEFVKNTRCQSALISYRGFHAHYLSPVTYAFSRLEGERVVEVREKGSFTNQRENEFASAGAYYFDSVQTLSDAVSAQEKLNLTLNDEYYTSLTVEALLRTNPLSNVRVYEVPAFYQWGTPEDLKTFEYWEKTYQCWARYQGHNMNVSHVQMPMAGLGSRFKNHFDSTPKPFLFIDETPMYRLALNSLPKGDTTSFVSLKPYESFFQTIPKKESVQFLNETPPGQALSVYSGLDLIPEVGDLIVSACDHSIVIDPTRWENFRKQSPCDAAIFTVSGFPGTLRRPQAYAYVKLKNRSQPIISSSPDDLESQFPEVHSVSVKVPLSESPILDQLLVGTFWFKNKMILKLALEQLIKKDTRVNGEVYLDSIFNIMIENGINVRVVPLDGYINWGDPDSLAEGLYWKEVFFGHRLSKRQRLEGVTEIKRAGGQ